MDDIIHIVNGIKCVLDIIKWFLCNFYYNQFERIQDKLATLLLNHFKYEIEVVCLSGKNVYYQIINMNETDIIYFVLSNNIVDKFYVESIWN